MFTSTSERGKVIDRERLLIPGPGMYEFDRAAKMLAEKKSFSKPVVPKLADNFRDCSGAISTHDVNLQMSARQIKMRMQGESEKNPNEIDARKVAVQRDPTKRPVGVGIIHKNIIDPENVKERSEIVKAQVKKRLDRDAVNPGPGSYDAPMPIKPGSKNFGLDTVAAANREIEGPVNQ